MPYPAKHQFSSSTITIPDGTGALGGGIVVIDYIVADITTDATINRVPLITVTAGGGSVMTVRKTIGTASTSDYFFLTFPSGFPMVGSDGVALGTITVAVSGTGVTLNGLAVGYHYRRDNG